PGHRLVVDCRGNTAEEPFFAWRFEPDEQMSFAEARERVRSSVTAAVQRRMVADVPIQCYLSGGLDFALVCGLMAERRGRFTAYHVSFPNSRYDESQQAAAIARHFGQSLETVACTPELLAEHLVRAVCHVEQPLANCNAIGKFLLSQRVR